MTLQERPLVQAGPDRKSTGRAADRRPRFRGTPRFWAGVGIVFTIVALATAAPLLTPYDPITQDLLNTLTPPSMMHPMGTDELGRDVWSRLLYGARIDLSIASAAVVAPFVIGVVIGALSGYFGGVVDGLSMRLADVVVAFPFYVLIIALVFALGGGVGSIFVAITLVGWVPYARIVRAEVQSLRERDFISACRVSGLGSARIIFRHLVPNTVSQAIVFAMSDIVMTILVIVTLSYFGLGITPPQPDWGQMLSDGQKFLLSGQYWLIMFPGLAVIITGLGLSLVGDGLVDAMRVKR
ncbi:ABC transporter permease [Microbacterium trichothecenolyticum]|nr:ABC transporter permease [Microbacterium trichothecenolyticum]